MNKHEQINNDLKRCIALLDDTITIGEDINKNLDQQNTQIQNMCNTRNRLDDILSSSLNVIKRINRLWCNT